MSVIKLVRRQKEDELENKARVYEEYCRMELSQKIKNYPEIDCVKKYHQELAVTIQHENAHLVRKSLQLLVRCTIVPVFSERFELVYADK
eukprot:gene6915-9549_t